MNKVEVFKMTEYADDRMREISFCDPINPFGSPDRGLSRDMDISTYKVRTIHKSMGISNLAPKEYQDAEMKRLTMKGFSFYSSDPFMITMVKEKKFIIADEMIDSAFNDIEKNNNSEDKTRSDLNQLLITMTCESNKLKHELKSTNVILDEYKNQLKWRKSFTLFQRIFQWKSLRRNN